MGRFGPRGPGFAYLVNRLLWQRQKDRKTAERHRVMQTWRVVRQVAAQSRLHQQPTPRVQPVDLPDKPPDRQDNSRYLACHHKTLVPPTKIPFQTASNRLIITPGRRSSGDSG